MKLSLRRRVGLALSRLFYWLGYWFDLHTAPKYDPTKDWPTIELTDAEWEEYGQILMNEEV